MSQVNPPAEPKKASNKSSVIIALLLIIVLVQSIKIYLDYKEKVEVKEVLAM